MGSAEMEVGQGHHKKHTFLIGGPHHNFRKTSTGARTPKFNRLKKANSKFRFSRARAARVEIQYTIKTSSARRLFSSNILLTSKHSAYFGTIRLLLRALLTFARTAQFATFCPLSNILPNVLCAALRDSAWFITQLYFLEDRIERLCEGLAKVFPGRGQYAFHFFVHRQAILHIFLSRMQRYLRSTSLISIDSPA